jgi:site-specific DNA-methyltransferase (adenine-specific)
VTPYYADDLVTIYHGDCREWMPEADVIVTDPPYGTGAYATDTVVLTGSMLASWPHAAVFGWPERLVALCMDAGRIPDEWVVWWPTNKPGARTPGLSRESEHIAVFGKVDGSTVMRRRSPNATGRAIATLRGNDPDWARDGDVWRDPSPFAGFLEGRLHPNEKPVSVMRKLALMMPGDTILDPFMGSGTTLVAAKSLGRRSIGIEIEERYCEIAANRCRQEVLGLGA